MSTNSVYYWQNYFDKEREFELKQNSYIVQVVIINQCSNDIYSEWISFPTEEELVGFIKYIVLPSGYCSKLFGEKESSLIIGADTYSNIMELLENNTYKVDNEIISQFNRTYNMIEKIEKGKFKFEDIKEFCNLYNSYLDDYKDVVFSNINIYTNIREVGVELIKEYEDDGMINELEEIFDMDKENVLELFSNIEDNPFMKRKITELLNNRIEL